MNCFYYEELVDIFANEYTTLVFVFLISDYQQDAFQPGILKSELYALDENIRVVDLTHSVKLNNIIEAAFIIGQYKPVADSMNVLIARVGAEKTTVLYQHENTLYVLPNNGLISLIFPEFNRKNAFCISSGSAMKAVRDYIRNNEIKRSEQAADIELRYMKPLQNAGGLIQAECIYTDGLGNCYFSITKQEFQDLVGDRPFEIRIQHYTGQRFFRILTHVTDVNPGDALLRFSKSGYLKLQINLGNASQLFRIRNDTKIIIEPG